MIHKALFWVSIVVMQMEDAELYEHGLALLEQTLHSLDVQGIFEYEKLEKIVMEVRKPLEWEFRPLDHQVGISFKCNFNFALVGYLLKGLRHQSQTTVQRTVRVMNTVLTLQAKATKRDRLEVTQDSVPYLTALLAVSEEVRMRCHLRAQTARTLSISAESLMLHEYPNNGSTPQHDVFVTTPSTRTPSWRSGEMTSELRHAAILGINNRRTTQNDVSHIPHRHHHRHRCL